MISTRGIREDENMSDVDEGLTLFGHRVSIQDGPEGVRDDPEEWFKAHPGWLNNVWVLPPGEIVIEFYDPVGDDEAYVCFLLSDTMEHFREYLDVTEDEERIGHKEKTIKELEKCIEVIRSM